MNIDEIFDGLCTIANYYDLLNWNHVNGHNLYVDTRDMLLNRRPREVNLSEELIKLWFPSMYIMMIEGPEGHCFYTYEDVELRIQKLLVDH